jgi:hypothetical protein
MIRQALQKELEAKKKQKPWRFPTPNKPEEVGDSIPNGNRQTATENTPKIGVSVPGKPALDQTIGASPSI